MLETLAKLFGEQLALSPDLWAILLVAVVVIAFVVTLVAGLVGGNFKKIKSLMAGTVKNPSVAVAQMKKMPASVKALYKNARMSNLKPSSLVTVDVCVEKPYKHSFISKVWLVTLVATLVCALLAFVIIPIAPVDDPAAAAAVAAGVYAAPALILILGGILTLVGGIVGRAAYGGAVKLYDKFAVAIDGDNTQSAQESVQQTEVYAAEPQADFIQAQGPQQVYAEPQQEFVEPQSMYAEPQNAYNEPPIRDDFGSEPYAEPVVMQQQESDEEIRRKAREEAMAQMRAQQAAAQAQAQAQQTPPPPPPVQPQAAPSSADDVIARIEQIDREGAPRETMREVATLLQKERAKPENKTPEQQRRLNEALSKLLKAMSAATKR